jgi:hypothetical protein
MNCQGCKRSARLQKEEETAKEGWLVLVGLKYPSPAVLPISSLDLATP